MNRQPTSVNIGVVPTFAELPDALTQAKKVVEEAAEVFAAVDSRAALKFWAKDRTLALESADRCIVNECADLIQAVANLMAICEVGDMAYAMQTTYAHNIKRGRFYAKDGAQ